MTVKLKQPLLHAARPVQNATHQPVHCPSAACRRCFVDIYAESQESCSHLDLAGLEFVRLLAVQRRHIHTPGDEHIP